jgi:hypothetical protein
MAPDSSSMAGLCPTDLGRPDCRSEVAYACLAGSGSAFLDFLLNGLRIFFFHLANQVWFAGYRCIGDISLINGLIGA